MSDQRETNPPPKFSHTVKLVGYIMASIIQFSMWAILIVGIYAGLSMYWEFGGSFTAWNPLWLLVGMFIAIIVGVNFLKFSLKMWKGQVFKWQNWYYAIKQEQKYRDVLVEQNRKHAEQLKTLLAKWERKQFLLEDHIARLKHDNTNLARQNKELSKKLYYQYTKGSS